MCLCSQPEKSLSTSDDSFSKFLPHFLPTHFTIKCCSKYKRYLLNYHSGLFVLVFNLVTLPWVDFLPPPLKHSTQGTHKKYSAAEPPSCSWGTVLITESQGGHSVHIQPREAPLACRVTLCTPEGGA